MGLCNLLCAISPCGELAFQTADHPTAGQARSFKKVTPCVGDLYKGYFLQHGDRKWLFQEDEVITFKQALAIYETVGRQLRGAYGVKAGESVGVCMKNMPEYMLSFCAASACGCRIVTLNSLWKTEELEYAVKDADCKVVFCDDQRMDLLTPFAKDMGLKLVLCGSKDQQRADSAGAVLWETVVKEGESQPKVNTSDIKFHDDAMIMYTSGSTGKPKGVVHSQRSLGTLICLLEMANFMAPDAQGCKTIMTVPLFHITGIGMFLASFISGQQLHMMKKWDAGKALDIIATHGITRFVGVPTMCRDMFEHPDFAEEKFKTIKTMGGGGQAMPPELMERIRKVSKGGQLQGYGLTETGGGVVVARGNDSVKHPDSTGKAIPFLVQVCIKDPKTWKRLGPEERGEICIKAATNMTRYHNKPEATKEVMDDEGFFHSGDVGKMNSAGYVFIMDRLKDIIIRGGENIDCTEVENMTYTFEPVRECSVFGLPDARLGEVVGLAVFPKKAGGVTPEEIREYLLKSGLSKFKVPDAENIFLSDEPLPQGPTGKIDKKGMRETYGEIVKARPAA